MLDIRPDQKYVYLLKAKAVHTTTGEIAAHYIQMVEDIMRPYEEVAHLMGDPALSKEFYDLTSRLLTEYEKMTDLNSQRNLRDSLTIDEYRVEFVLTRHWLE